MHGIQHVIQRLRDLGDIPNNSLVTMDVKSLYTVIPHELGIWATQRALTTNPPSNTPIQFLQLTLTRNYFRFENSYHLQISGTVMGSALAPSYANLFMLKFELEYILLLLGNPSIPIFATLMICL
ncbi:hypothetical protein XENTR_v10000262 [Xenopus tropicalis]|nr:hypothetical protein XENTR_v10000262 [Xenopus tropicalis]